MLMLGDMAATSSREASRRIEDPGVSRAAHAWVADGGVGCSVSTDARRRPFAVLTEHPT